MKYCLRWAKQRILCRAKPRANMKLGNSNETIQYTQFVEVDYKNEAVPACVNWQPGIPFETGNYEVEIYNKGFMSGKASFVLK